MFSDIFVEYMVKKKFDAKDYALTAMFIALTVILSVALFFVSVVIIPAFSSVAMLVMVGAWYGCYFLVTRRMIEYECTLTNSEMDIDKIIAKRKRKRLISFDFKEADLVACVKDNAHNGILKKFKVQDYSGDSQCFDAYFVDITISGERNIILFTPTDKMLEGIKRFNPQNVFIME